MIGGGLRGERRFLFVHARPKGRALHAWEQPLPTLSPLQTPTSAGAFTLAGSSTRTVVSTCSSTSEIVVTK